MKNSLTILLFSIIFGTMLMFGCDHNDDGEDTRIFLVRHAERPDNVDTLNSTGHQRAAELERVLAKSEIDIIFASTRYRTQQTAQPLASALGLELNLYDPSDLQSLVDLIKAEHQGKNILVSGHSNSTPNVVNLFGHTPPLSEIDHEEYDLMFIVDLDEGEYEELLVLEYGGHSPAE